MTEPIAYLLREHRGSFSQILCGKMFMNLDTATAAAGRMSNHWRTVTVVPVHEVSGEDAK